VSIATVNGVQIHYQTKGSGPDVVLLHGVTSSLALWYGGVVTELASQYRVTAFDMRGHGRSEITPTGYTTRDMAGDLVGLMDHIGIASARLVGHSYGGCVAMHTALLHPERVDGVVLLDSGLACLRRLRTIDEWPGWKQMRGQLRKFGFSYDMFKRLDAQEDVSEIFRRSFSVPVQFGFRKGQLRGTPRLQKLINETTVGRDFREIAGMTEDRLPEISVPVLALYGSTSPYINIAKYLSENLPNCLYRTLPETGHFYLLQEPKSATDRMSGFLADPLGFIRAARASLPVQDATAQLTPALNED
jgi:pimeloyl-ACP methyl ester carboxylesterase